MTFGECRYILVFFSGSMLRSAIFCLHTHVHVRNEMEEGGGERKGLLGVTLRLLNGDAMAIKRDSYNTDPQFVLR